MKQSQQGLSLTTSLRSSLSTDSDLSPSKPFPQLRRSCTITPSSSELSNARIIQSKLVYIINLPESVASDETLKRPEYFGQYGTILKCVVNKSSQHTAYQAYITYNTDEEAAVCIKACNKFVLDGNELTLTFGTTKYCNYFLRGNSCPKPECLYLHQFAQHSNIISRESMPHTKHIQPSNSIIDGIKVLVFPPDHSHRLPSVKIIRERAYSQNIFDSPVRCFDNKSRFGFLVDGDETEVPVHMKALRKYSSPKEDVAEIPLSLYQDLIGQFFSDHWLRDVLDFELQNETVLVFPKPNV